MNTQQPVLGNITNSGPQSQQSRSQEIIGQKSININKARDGDYAEYWVSLEAWKRGAEVFKNVGKSGPIDLVLQINGRLLPCDVKSNTQTRQHKPTLDPKLRFDYYQTQLDRLPEHVYMICYHPITKKISWHTNRVPEGLENFWK